MKTMKLNMNKRINILIGATLIGFVTYYFASPYVAANSLVRAVNSKDAETVSEYVDFPALRESMRTKLQVKLTQEVARDGSPGAALGAALGSMVLEPMLNALVSPAGLVTLLNGTNPLAQDQEKSTEGSTIESRGKPNLGIKYKGLDKVHIVDKNIEDGNGFVFRRRGLFGWKITDITMEF